MKTILLTGGTGFLGSSMLKKIHEKYKIILLKRSYSKIEKIQNIINHKNIIIYNLDQININDIFKQNTIDIIFHCATSYGRKGESDIDIIKSNLIFPLELLKYSIKYNVKSFYNIDTFYKSTVNLPKGLDLYVLSKKQFLEYGKLYSKKNKSINFINLILYHLYGANDNATKFIPSLIKELYSNINDKKLTKGEQIIDFIYIDDATNLIKKVINKGIYGNIFKEYEIGTGKGIKLKDLILKIKDKLKSNTNLLFGELPYRKGESMKEIANTNEINKIGIDIQNIGIDKGLDKTIDYYINNK